MSVLSSLAGRHRKQHEQPIREEAENDPDVMPKNDPSEDFHSLIERYQEQVRDTCYRFVGNVEDADDLAQDVFVKVFRSMERFRSEAETATWLYRIAINASLDFLRKASRKKRFARLVGLGSREGEPEIDVPAPGDPHQELEERERRELLSWALDGLPEKQRTAIILSKYEQLPVRDIAAILDVTPSAVDALLQRAKHNLRRQLQNYFEHRR
jgi:RNA polymerase sigma-70 factor (ECF subfamily)